MAGGRGVGRASSQGSRAHHRGIAATRHRVRPRWQPARQRETAPRFLLRDRDSIYGTSFRDRIEHLRIEEVVSAPRSPWQNPFVERLIGSVRRECLDHRIVLNERHLLGVLKNYFAYYHVDRTHLSLGKDAPEPRSVEPADLGNVVALPRAGGIHHRYVRRAA